jgi:hypothetical protein
MESAAKKAYEEVWWEEIEDQVLKPILLTKADFAARSANVQPLDTKLVLKLAEEMSSYKRDCTIIFCGFDGDAAHMFQVATPCQVDPMDWQGFACIGGGLETARNEMIWSDYDKDDDLESTLFDVFNAKVATEVIQGVGYAWDWRILLPGKKPEPLPALVDKHIDQLWVLHNRHPFALPLKDAETKRKKLLESIEQFAASLVKPKKRRVKREPKLSPIRYSAPTNVYQDESGMWVFDYFPEGERTRYGAYQDREEAIREWEKATSDWIDRDGLTPEKAQT